MEMMFGQKPSFIWKILWGGVTPLILLVGFIVVPSNNNWFNCLFADRFDV
jgi:hypothetical protein